MSLPREIIIFCELLAKHKGIRSTAGGSAKGAAIAGAGAFVGGLLGGPGGLIIGGAIGSVLGGLLSLTDYKSLYEVIKEDLTEAERRELAAAVSAVVRNTNPHLVMFGADMLLAEVVQDGHFESVIFDVIKKFFAERDISLNTF